jgi:dTDP-glucose 4,6-dehydratase
VVSRITERSQPYEPDPILVTGGAGLLGLETVRQLLSAGWRVRSVDRAVTPLPDPVEVVTGDMLDSGVCRAACAGIRTIIHAAAVQYHSGLPRLGRRRFFAQNTQITRNLVDAAIADGVTHLVMVSSDMSYGLPTAAPMPETAPQHPNGPYGRSKLESERLCLAARQHGLSVTILRPRLIVGPGRLGVLRRLFDRIRAGKSVPVIGSGENCYQMVAVADVASACLAAARRPTDGAFNIGSADPPPVNDLLADLCRRARSKSRLVHLPGGLAKLGLWALDLARISPMTREQYSLADVNYVLDIARAAHELDWRPAYSDSDMLWAAYQSYVTGHTGQVIAMRAAPEADLVVADRAVETAHAAPGEAARR